MEILLEVETLYVRVRDLARTLAGCLRSGEVAAIPSLVGEKLQALSKAQALIRALQESGAADKRSTRFQEALIRMAAVLSQAARIEDECQTLTLPATPALPRQQALSAYGKAGAPRRPDR
jgi:hypothetical protein